MFEFWLFTLAMLLIAIMFLFVPAIRFVSQVKFQDVMQTEKAEFEYHNVQIFKDRLMVLEQEFLENKLSEQIYQQLKSELESVLISDLDQSQSSESKGNTTMKKNTATFMILIASALFLALGSYGGYFKWGAYAEVVDTTILTRDASDKHMASNKSDSADLLIQLHEKLQQNPNNLQGWRLLARSAMNTNNYDLATKAFLEIIRMTSSEGEGEEYNGSAPIYGLLAQAYYYGNDNRINEDVQAALDEALKRDPNELNSLDLIAIDAYTNKNYATSIEYWERILKISPTHESKDAIEKGIAHAKAAMRKANNL